MSADVFLVLAAVAGADAEIVADESAALERAAREDGLSDAEIRAMREASRGGVDGLDVSRIASGDRPFVYAMAYWMSRLDGEMSEAEDAVLGALGRKLALADDARMALEGAVDEIAALPHGDRPERFDIARLRSMLSASR